MPIPIRDMATTEDTRAPPIENTIKACQNLNPSNPTPLLSLEALAGACFSLPRSPIPDPVNLTSFLSLHFKHLPVFSSFFFTPDPYSSGLAALHPPYFLLVPTLCFSSGTGFINYLLSAPHHALRSLVCPQLTIFLTFSYHYCISASVDNLLASASIPLPHLCPCLSRKCCLLDQGSCPHWPLQSPKPSKLSTLGLCHQ